MKTCADVQQLASEYIDGELENAGTTQMFLHLGECQECRDFMTSLLRLRSAIRDTVLVTPTNRNGNAKPVWRRRFSVSYAAAAAITCIMLAVGAIAVQRIAQEPKIFDRTHTEYVYLTPFAPVYAVENASAGTTNQN